MNLDSETGAILMSWPRHHVRRWHTVATVAEALASMAAAYDALPVVVRADQFAAPAGVPREIRGAQIAAQQAITFSRGATAARLALINGIPGLIVAPRGKLARIIRFGFADNAIAQLEVLPIPPPWVKCRSRFSTSPQI